MGLFFVAVACLVVILLLIKINKKQEWETNIETGDLLCSVGRVSVVLTEEDYRLYCERFFQELGPTFEIPVVFPYTNKAGIFDPERPAVLRRIYNTPEGYAFMAFCEYDGINKHFMANSMGDIVSRTTGEILSVQSLVNTYGTWKSDEIDFIASLGELMYLLGKIDGRIKVAESRAIEEWLMSQHGVSEDLIDFLKKTKAPSKDAVIQAARRFVEKCRRKDGWIAAIRIALGKVAEADGEISADELEILSLAKRATEIPVESAFDVRALLA